MRLKTNRLLEKMDFKSDENIDKTNSISIRLTSDLCHILEEYIIKVSIYQTPPELVFADDSVMIEIQYAI
jgi:hypothetical protein